MSNILSFIDHEYKMNLMKMVRLIIDFGWYPHAKFLFEKYYSELPNNTKLFSTIVDSKTSSITQVTAVGIYLFKIMGYPIKPFKNYNLFIDIIHNDKTDIWDDIKYDEWIVNSFNILNNTYYNIRSVKDYINKYCCLDLNKNTLELNSNNKHKFTFAVPLVLMLNKHITIDNTLYKLDISNNDLYKSQVIEYIHCKFTFDINQLITLDSYNYKIIHMDKDNIITEDKMKKIIPLSIQNVLLNKFIIQDSKKYSNTKYKTDRHVICENNTHILLLVYKKGIVNYEVYENNDDEKIEEFIKQEEEESALFKYGSGIKLHVFGENVIFLLPLK
jgi:hypothetical protein